MSSDSQNTQSVGRVSSIERNPTERSPRSPERVDVGLSCATQTYEAEWSEMHFGSFVALQRGHDLPDQDRRPGKVPILGSFGITGFHDTVKAKGPGVTIGRSGASFGVASYINLDYWPLNTALYVIDFKGNDPKFTYYFFKQFDFSAYNSGSAQPSLNRNNLYGIPIRVPPPSIQKQIALFLTILDDRIALLRETNATLEAIAQALFKSWFVDFDPVHAKQQGRVPEGAVQGSTSAAEGKMPEAALEEATAALFPDSFEESELGLVPKGWKIELLGDWLSVLETGRRPKGGVSGIESGIPSIGAESIIRAGEFDFSKTKYVSDEYFGKMKSGRLESRDVLLYKDGGKPGVFLPRVSMFGDGFPFQICGINEHVFRIRLKKPFGQTFLYFWLWSDAIMHELKHRGGKAAIPGINQADVKEQRLLIPDKQVLSRFDDLTSPLISRIFSNATQIQTLATLRDTLLPRLISGQLRLPEAEGIIEFAGA